LKAPSTLWRLLNSTDTKLDTRVILALLLESLFRLTGRSSFRLP
jgi:hypothetical protein